MGVRCPLYAGEVPIRRGEVPIQDGEVHIIWGPAREAEAAGQERGHGVRAAGAYTRPHFGSTKAHSVG